MLGVFSVSRNPYPITFPSFRRRIGEDSPGQYRFNLVGRFSRGERLRPVDGKFDGFSATRK
jgi:hypothetical protein